MERIKTCTLILIVLSPETMFLHLIMCKDNILALEIRTNAGDAEKVQSKIVKAAMQLDVSHTLQYISNKFLLPSFHFYIQQ